MSERETTQAVDLPRWRWLGFAERPVRWVCESESRVFSVVTLLLSALALVLLPWLRARLGIDVNLGGPAHDGYVELARNLAAGHGFVFEPDGAAVFHRPPLYPVSITPVMWLPEGWQRPLITAIDVLCAAGTAALGFGLARRAFDRRVAALATLLLVGNPWMIAKLGVGMLPILQMLLFTALLVALSRTLALAPTRDAGPSGPRAIAGIGVLAAALALTHGGMLVTLVLLGLGWVVAMRVCGPPRYGVAVGALCVLVAGIAPWTLRNEAVTGRPIPVAGNAGFAYVLSQVHWDEIDTTAYRERPDQPLYGQPAAFATLAELGLEGPPEDHYHFYGLKDPALDARLTGEMIADILARPVPFARRVALNTMEYFAPITWPVVMRGDQPLRQPILRWKSKLARSVAFVVLLSLAVAGLVRARGERRAWALWLAWGLASFAAPYSLLYASRSDYSIGLIPVLSILAAVGVFPHPPRAAGQGL